MSCPGKTTDREAQLVVQAYTVLDAIKDDPSLPGARRWLKKAKELVPRLGGREES